MCVCARRLDEGSHLESIEADARYCFNFHKLPGYPSTPRCRCCVHDCAVYHYYYYVAGVEMIVRESESFMCTESAHERIKDRTLDLYSRIGNR